MKAKVNGYEIECSVDEFRELIRLPKQKTTRREPTEGVETGDFRKEEQPTESPVVKRKRTYKKSTAPNTYNAWTDSEDRLVMDYYSLPSNYTPSKKIKQSVNKYLSNVLGRTRASITFRACHKLKCHLHPYNKRDTNGQ